MPDERFTKAFNSRLPRDVRAVSAEPVADDFHARYSARRRIYKYYILPAEHSDPFTRRFCLTVKRELSLQSLNNYAAGIVGTHDFATFTAAGDKSESTVREVFSSAFYVEGRFIVFKIEGNAFLWKMVRSLVGTMLAAGAEDRSPSQFSHTLKACDRSLAGDTAPSKGLFLYKVVYDE